MSIVYRPRPSYDTVGDNEVSIPHKLHVNAVPALSINIHPFPEMRCLDMHMCTVNSTNSIGHPPQ